MALSYGIKPLPINKALELYDILGKYIPEPEDGEQTIDFIGKIIDNIAKDESGAYADAIMLMTGHTLKELEEFSSEYLLELFAVGLSVNDISGLKKFCKDINYG